MICNFYFSRGMFELSLHYCRFIGVLTNLFLIRNDLNNSHSGDVGTKLFYEIFTEGSPPQGTPHGTRRARWFYPDSNEIY